MNIWSLERLEVQGVLKRSSSQPFKCLSVSPNGRLVYRGPRPKKDHLQVYGWASAHTRNTWEVEICLGVTCRLFQPSSAVPSYIVNKTDL